MQNRQVERGAVLALNPDRLWARRLRPRRLVPSTPRTHERQRCASTITSRHRPVHSVPNSGTHSPPDLRRFPPPSTGTDDDGALARIVVGARVFGRVMLVALEPLYTRERRNVRLAGHAGRQ